ncbi:MAG: restriction endonuclease subunit S, partial [Chloroflexi bacterium]|nr:restriction endonuclease subunit S [Chloroflexota bacterium]
ITEEALESSSAKVFPTNTVLMAMYGDGDTITTLGVLRRPAATNQACCAMMPDPGICDWRYLFYALKHTRPDLLRVVVGGAQRNLSGSIIRQHRIPLPPLAEQKAIADILGSLDDKIELNRRMNVTLEAMARALFKSWFVDFDPVRAKMDGRAPAGMDAETAALFPARLVDSELGPIPEGWRVESVYAIANVVYGAPFASSQFNSTRSGYPLIRIRDLRDEAPSVFTTEIHPKGRLVVPGDIVVGMDGEFRAHVWGGPVSYLNQRLCVFEPTGASCKA